MPTQTKARDRERLTLKQIAQELNIGVVTVARWIRKGWLAAEELPGGSRVTREALERFLAEKPWSEATRP